MIDFTLFDKALKGDKLWKLIPMRFLFNVGETFLFQCNYDVIHLYLNQKPHPTFTLPGRDFGRSMKESLKRATKWSAFYFTHANSYNQVPQIKVPLGISQKIKRFPVHVRGLSRTRIHAPVGR